MDEVSTNQVYRFAEFTLDSGRASLFRGGDEVPLRQRTFEVLTYLVRNSGRLVSKQELFEAVWQDVAVTDDWYEAHGVGKRGLKIKRFLD